MQSKWIVKFQRAPWPQFYRFISWITFEYTGIYSNFSIKIVWIYSQNIFTKFDYNMTSNKLIMTKVHVFFEWPRTCWQFSIHVQNLFLSTATKQLHLNFISKLILRFSLLLTKHNKERWIPYPCRLSSPLSSSSKTLSKHILSTLCFDSAFTLFMEQSEFVRLRAERFWNCQTERTFILASGYWISIRVEPWLIIY
jgi:hypothetical protein